MTDIGVEGYWDEIKAKTLAQQEAKMQTYHALKELALPIPHDLNLECRGTYEAWKAKQDGDNCS